MTIANVPNITTASASISTSAVKTEDNGKMSFSSIMGQATNNAQYSSAGQKASANLDNSNSSGQSNDTTSATRQSDGSTTKKLDNSDNASKKTETKTDRVSDKTDKTDGMDKSDDVVKDVQDDVIATAVNQIKEQLMEVLDVTPEQLEGLMEDLGLTDMDLLSGENVLQVVMEQTGMETTVDLLNNEELAQLTKGLMETVNQVNDSLEDMGITVALEPMTQAMNAEENVMDTSAVEVDDQSVMVDDVKVTVETEVQKDTENNQGQMQRGQDQNQSTETPVQQVAQTVFDNLTQAVNNTQEVSYATTTQAVDIVNQVVEEIRTVVKADTTSMEVQLNPENLGKVNIQVSARDGIVTAHITAQTEAARHAIESQIAVLKENFQNQGLKVEAVEVAINPRGFSMDQEQSFNEQEQQQSQKSKKQISLDDLDLDSEELTEEESIAVDMMQRAGNKVDFTA